MSWINHDCLQSQARKVVILSSRMRCSFLPPFKKRMSQLRFRELESSTDPYDKMHRCQILHYSRRDPFTGTNRVTRKCKQFQAEILWTPQFLRSSCPVFPERARNEWERITYPTYTSDQLQELVDRVPQLVNNDLEKEKELDISKWWVDGSCMNASVEEEPLGAGWGMPELGQVIFLKEQIQVMVIRL